MICPVDCTGQWPMMFSRLATVDSPPCEIKHLANGAANPICPSNVHLSPEAEAYFREKAAKCGCSQPLKAIHLSNRSNKKIGLFT